MVNTIKLNTGVSVKDYNKVSDWLSFETPDKILISSGKVDIGQHLNREPPNSGPPALGSLIMVG